MTFLLSRARRLFFYGNLDAHGSGGGSNGILGSEEASSLDGVGGMGLSAAAAAKQHRRRRRRMVVAVVLLGILIVFIIAASSRHRAVVERQTFGEQGQGEAADKITGKDNEFSSATKSNRKPVRLEDVISGKFRPSNFASVNATWISDEEFIFKSFSSGIQVVNVAKPEEASKVVLSGKQLRVYFPYKYSLSADRQYLLLQRGASAIFRHSSIGEYVVIPVGAKNKMNEITLGPGRDRTNNAKRMRYNYDDDDGDFLVKHASFAPTGNALAYVGEDNNIYYRKSVMDQDEKLTDTGDPGVFFNGVADWVFEEEVLEDDRALWWAPDGNSLVFGSFNDSQVHPIQLKSYGTWRHLEKYPQVDEIRYPKAGTTNPECQLWRVDLSGETAETRQISPPASLGQGAGGEAPHFSGIKFVNSDTFAVKWMNRVQTKTVVTLCQTKGSGECKEVFANYEREGWVDYKYDVHFRGDGDASRLVTTLSDPHSVHRFRQVVLVDSSGTRERTQLTHMLADVVKVLKWAKDGYVYFIATMEDRPGTRQLFRVMTPSGSPECLTCNMTDHGLGRKKCTHYEISMSKDATYFFMTCKGPDVPYTCICRTDNGKLVKVYDDNKALEWRLNTVNLPTVKMMDIPASVKDHAPRVRARVYLPPDLNPNVKYPTLVKVYGGPGSQIVDETFDQFDYQTYLAGTKGFVFIMLDPQGTGWQGDTWAFSLKNNFGGPDVNSTIDAVLSLQRDLSYVDPNRTAIWGWSYGAFLSLSILGNDVSDVFRCGASVAPVVDWRLYDTYYTERYMGLPQDNHAAAYNRSSVFKRLDTLRHKPFYLLHGTQDDNVHFQQSMLLSAALEANDILFRQQAYPDQDHSIMEYQQHLYHSLTDFFLNDCFKDRKIKR